MEEEATRREDRRSEGQEDLACSRAGETRGSDERRSVAEGPVGPRRMEA